MLIDDYKNKYMEALRTHGETNLSTLLSLADLCLALKTLSREEESINDRICYHNEYVRNIVMLSDMICDNYDTAGEALDYMCEKVREKIKSDNSGYYLDVLIEIGSVYSRIEDHRTALVLFEEANENAERVLFPVDIEGKLYKLIILSKIGKECEILEDYDKALNIFKSQNEIAREVYHSDRAKGYSHVVESYKNLIRVYDNNGDIPNTKEIKKELRLFKQKEKDLRKG